VRLREVSKETRSIVCVMCVAQRVQTSNWTGLLACVGLLSEEDSLESRSSIHGDCHTILLGVCTSSPPPLVSSTSPPRPRVPTPREARSRPVFPVVALLSPLCLRPSSPPRQVFCGPFPPSNAGLLASPIHRRRYYSLCHGHPHRHQHLRAHRRRLAHLRHFRGTLIIICDAIIAVGGIELHRGATTTTKRWCYQPTSGGSGPPHGYVDVG